MKYGAISSVRRAFNRVNGRSASERRRAMIRGTIDQSGLFDARFYRQKCGGQLSGGVDPLDHYIQHAADNRLAPNPWFDTAFYLDDNPDVAQAGLNPLFHFAQHGWRELRSPSAESYDFVWHWVMENRASASIENPMKRHCAQHMIAPDSVSVRARRPLTAEEIPLFTEACHDVLTAHQLNESALRIIGQYTVENKLWASAEEVFHALILKRPDVLDYRLSLAAAVERQGRIWQLADVLADAATQTPQNAELSFRLGDAQERMGRYAEAATSFAKALAINDDIADWHYRHGYALERAGQTLSARTAYDAARERDKKHNSANLGVGILHQNRGLWKDAATAYAATAALKPGDPELWFKLGFAYDRCYEWAKAQQAYSVALSHQFGRPYWHYRLGFVLERQGKWHEAAGAYRTGADMDTQHRSYWYYRCGYVFEKAGAFAEACSAYLLTSETNWSAFKASGAGIYAEWFPRAQTDTTPPNAITHGIAKGIASAVSEYVAGISREGQSPAVYRRASHAHAKAKMMELHGQLEAAAQTYQLALDLSADHKPAWHRDLGALLTRLGRYEDGCEAFRNSRILKRPYGIDTSRYEANKNTRALMEYCEYLETLPVRKNVVLYDSFHAISIGCNPYAIFRYIIDRPEFAGWTHIWAINDLSGIPKEYANRENVIFIPRNSDAYRRHLATAEYLINNTSFPYWFIRREEQKYLNTWHGTPLKGLGRDVKNEPMSYGNITKNFLHATHLLSPNSHTSDVMMKRFDVAGIYGGKLAETGYPRIDQVVNNDDQRKRQVLEALGLEPGKPIVLYAPTWRGALGRMQIDIDRVIADVSAMAGDDYQLVFRGHYFEESALAGMNIPITIAPHRIDTGDLLSVVDVLVTDYSSIFFDFLPSGRPIVYYAHDLEKYSEERSLYFDIADMPGTLCREIEEVRQAITRGLDQSIKSDPAYQPALTRFCPFEDGNSTQRAVEFLFFNSDEFVVDRYEDTRRSIVMYNGMFPINGITSSYLNLLRNLEGEDIQISTLYDPAKIRIDPVRVQNFGSMPENIKCIAQLGTMVRSPEEIWISAHFAAARIPESREMWDIYLRTYRREYRRLLGDARHDTFVNFEGYNFAVTHIAAGAPTDVRKVLYLHNDMIGERDVRLPYLQRIFRLYDHYDCLISVSRAICQVNQEKLRQEFNINKEKFLFCENTISPDGIKSLAEEQLDHDLKPWFGNGNTFLCLARMSPEKGQAKLIRAFSDILAEGPDAKLVILGDGPSRRDLNLLIEELGIGENVKLARARMNPFPALRSADCLVLSSDHEGQGLVLIEAMVLGKPIIATDIAASRDVLADKYGELVENSEVGLRQGMLGFLERGGRPYSFDTSEYQANAIRSFRNVVLAEGENETDISAACPTAPRRLTVATPTLHQATQ